MAFSSEPKHWRPKFEVVIETTGNRFHADCEDEQSLRQAIRAILVGKSSGSPVRVTTQGVVFGTDIVGFFAQPKHQDHEEEASKILAEEVGVFVAQQQMWRNGIAPPAFLSASKYGEASGYQRSDSQ